MIYKAATPEEYISQLPPDRKDSFNKLRETILQNLPAGYEEGIQYGMLGYYVPLSIYPKGYRGNRKQPLPFTNLASQKNYIALYHSGLYAQPELLKWFKANYPKHCHTKLDMGKSCVRFKKMDSIPFDLIAQLMQKITVNEWIQLYEGSGTN